jgi:hypothetical protein
LLPQVPLQEFGVPVGPGVPVGVAVGDPVGEAVGLPDGVAVGLPEGVAVGEGVAIVKVNESEQTLEGVGVAIS